MFHSDSKGQVVWTYDYDAATGTVANRRVLARPTEEIGRPDGCPGYGLNSDGAPARFPGSIVPKS